MKMNLRRRRAVRLLLLLVVATFPVIGAAQLNPTVKVLPRATAPVPSECDHGLAPQAPLRVIPEETVAIPETKAEMKAPPSATLRAELRTALEAAQEGRRDTFRDSLSRAKNILATYPPGGERTAANDVIAVFDDLDKLWDFQFTSPTGAFFEAGGDVYRVANKYPRYDTYIRRQTVVDQNGIRFYPSRETRDFLAAEAAERFARLTGRPLPPRPPAREPVVTQAQRKPAPSKAPSREPSVRKPVTHEARATTQPPAHRTKPTRPKPAPIVTTTHGTPKPRPAPSTTTHATETTKTLAPPSPPIVTTTTAATTSSAPPPTETAATTSSAAPTTTSQPPPTTTTASTTTTSDTTTPQAAKTTPTPSRGRSFFIPILLIVVGLGVLVMLFRASS
ncbi:MAG TPA: hypothetical protein VGS96_17605 [Thermoanaerobaculia bacterium]|nr:hypothetical protein [Thermoanaerobaculia bacterium]